MSTLSKNWAVPVELAVTDAFGGAVADLTADQKYDYTGDVDLETGGYEGAQVFVETKLNFSTNRALGASASPCGIIVDVFASLDGVSYDTIPFMTRTIKGGADTDWRRLTLIVKDVAHFRIGLRTTGTEDSYDYRITHQRWNTDDS